MLTDDGALLPPPRGYCRPFSDSTYTPSIQLSDADFLLVIPLRILHALHRGEADAAEAPAREGLMLAKQLFSGSDDEVNLRRLRFVSCTPVELRRSREQGTPACCDVKAVWIWTQSS